MSLRICIRNSNTAYLNNGQKTIETTSKNLNNEQKQFASNVRNIDMQQNCIIVSNVRYKWDTDNTLHDISLQTLWYTTFRYRHFGTRHFVTRHFATRQFVTRHFAIDLIGQFLTPESYCL